jgi:AcrR family transcriptional regulator
MTDGPVSPPPPRNLPPERPGQAGGKRDRNRRERTATIATSALELMLASGVEGVTIDDICTRAGIAKGSFYRYFAGKTELVTAVLEPLAAKFRAALGAAEKRLGEARDPDTLFEAYAAMAAALAPAFEDEQGAVRLYLQECRGPAVGARVPVRALVDELTSLALTLTHASRRHGLLRMELPAEVTSLAVLGAIERIAFDYLNGRLNHDPITLGAALVDTILEGVAVRDVSPPAP